MNIDYILTYTSKKIIGWVSVLCLLPLLSFSGCTPGGNSGNNSDTAHWFRSDFGHSGSNIILPETFSENIDDYLVWKNDSPSLAPAGNSSGIIAAGRLILTGSDEKGNSVAALDISTGQCLWQKYFPVAEDFEGGEYGLACSSPCYSDGRIVAFFADGFAYCLDLSGELLWSQHVATEPINSFGLASSPVIAAGSVVFQVDLDEDMDTEQFRSFITALSLQDGSRIWRAERPVWPSWSTPVVFDRDTRQYILTTAAEWAIMYDASTGAEIWRCNDMIGDVAATAVLNETASVCYVFSDPSGDVMAIDATGSGDVTQSHILWRNETDPPDVASGLYWQGKVYYCGSGFELHCLDAATGEQLWSAELDEAVYASPIILGGRICLVDTAGNIDLYGPATGKKQHVLTLDSEVNATPTVTADRIFIRTTETIMCLDLSQ